MSPSYTHIVVDIHDQIGVIKVCPTIVTRTVYAPCLPQQLNRPKVLNAWNETMLADMVTAFRELDQHPRTIFTVLTGEGRFFSAGADIRQGLATPPPDSTAAQKKLFYMRKFSIETELFRLMIDHRKVFVLALNGPGVGGGAAWFTGLADIVLAASGSYLQVPFNSLGLVPEFGAARTFAQSMGVRRANEFLMFGRKCTVEELEGWGLVNRGFPLEGFGGHVLDYLRGQLEVNDGGSILETKRLMNGPMRAERVVALFDAVSALAERFVEGVPAERFERRTGELKKVSEERRGKEKSSL